MFKTPTYSTLILRRLQSPIICHCHQRNSRRYYQTLRSLRRRRAAHEKGSEVAGTLFPKQRVNALTGQTEPYDASAENNKNNLSPWVPLPDVVARKALDMAKAGSEDIHIDLGSGDGRVNFHAVDAFNVKLTIGIEVDEKLVEAANTRLRKRHPLPKNIQFMTADLLAHNLEDPGNIWLNVIPNATIITFFFAQPQMIRERLELSLIGKRCKVVSCGYEMPGWESTEEEIILGNHIYVYEFGGDNASTFRGEDFEIPPEVAAKAFGPAHNKLAGAKIVDNTRKSPIRGFSLDDILADNEDDIDDDVEDWDRYNREEAEREAKEKAEKEAKKKAAKEAKDKVKIERSNSASKGGADTTSPVTKTGDKKEK